MIVGIDPGINGAAAALNAGGFAEVIDLPTHWTGKWREINDVDFLEWLRRIEPDRIVIENVHSMPGEGVRSVFRFGVAFGMLKAMCHAYLGIHSLELVEPAVWKGYFNLPGRDKEAARTRAIKLFPNEAGRLHRKLDHQRAEAMLIAWWADRPIIGKD